MATARDQKHVAYRHQRDRGLFVLRVGVEKAPAQVGPAAGTLETQLPGRLVDLGPTVDQDHVGADALAVGRGVLALHGRGEGEERLLLVRERPQSARAQLSVGADLHRHPGAVAQNESRSSTICFWTAFAVLPARLAMQRDVFGELVHEHPDEQPVSAQRPGRR